MSIRGIHHVQITIPPGSEARAREFYNGVLGLREISKPDSLQSRGGLWLEVGGRQLHIGVESGVQRSDTRAHVAYEVDDLARWRRTLSSVGIVTVASVPISGFDRLEIRDPFGNRIELIQPLA